MRVLRENIYEVINSMGSTGTVAHLGDKLVFGSSNAAAVELAGRAGSRRGHSMLPGEQAGGASGDGSKRGHSMLPAG